MTSIHQRFLFACAPDSWGVLDYPGPSWNQSYEKMLDEMVQAGYTGTELGPYGLSMLVAPGPIEEVQASVRIRKLALANALAVCTIACSFRQK